MAYVYTHSWKLSHEKWRTARRQGDPGRLPVVNYTVGLAWPAPPQTHLYNFLEGSNSSVKRAPLLEGGKRDVEGNVSGEEAEEKVGMTGEALHEIAAS